MKKIRITCVLIVLSFTLKAQYYTIGEDPARIHWRQINTSDFQVIYPSDFEAKAQHLSAMLERVYQYAGQSLNHKPHKISVILHTRTVTSNGLVSWAPARMELLTTPPQDTYAQQWLDQLALHEFRHVVQLDKIDSELPNLFKIILGQQATGIVVGIYLPLWLLEGDAVASETAFSHAGRGRLPSFEMELKAQVLEKKLFSYDKNYLGSYKDHVPDYYQMGYQMVAGARQKYGREIWGKVLHKVARNPETLFPFSRALKKNTGKNQTGLYREIFADLSTKWRQEDQNLIKTPFQRITRENRNYTDYNYPHFVNDSTYFALKNSIDDQPRFVIISKTGKEKRIFTPGYLSDKSVSFADSRVFWIETKPDPRWANQEFSLLRFYNIHNGHLFEKRFKNKIYAPGLSYDKKYIACVQINNQNNCAVLLISPETGKLIQAIPTPDNLLFISPTWGEKENILYAVVLGPKGKSIVRFNPFTRELSYLLPFSYNNLNDPLQRGDFLYFNSSQSGIDNIYAVNLKSKRTFQVTSSRFGTQFPRISPDGTRMIYQDYTGKGFVINQISLVNRGMKEVNPSSNYDNRLAHTLTVQEKNVIPQVTDSVGFKSSNYSKIGHLFNIHSWAPFRIDADHEEIRPGFSILSQNMLSTAITQAGYDYSTINKTGKWFLKFDYLGFLPVLGFQIDYGNGKSHYYRLTRVQNQLGQVVRIDTSLIGFNYKELNLNADIRLPLNLSHGKYIRFLQPEFQIGYTNIMLDPTLPKELFRGTVIPFTYRIYASNYLISGFRDLQPKWGQIVNLEYRNTPVGNADYGSIASVEGTLYAPGLFRHHGLRIYGGFQSKNAATYSYSDFIEYPRGYQSITNDRLFTIKSDYVLPLFYPDWNLSKLAYIKRFSLRAFYDHGNARIPGTGGSGVFYKDFNSIGTEWTANVHFFRFIIPSTIGIRHSYLLESRSNIFEMLFSFNFSGFRTF